MISYCGINCAECEARRATVNNDDALRAQVAEKWSAMNNEPSITPETINCLGCRQDGVRFYFCSHLCEVRKCAVSKGLDGCAACSEKVSCALLNPFRSNPDICKNLGL